MVCQGKNDLNMLCADMKASALCLLKECTCWLEKGLVKFLQLSVPSASPFNKTRSSYQMGNINNRRGKTKQLPTNSWFPTSVKALRECPPTYEHSETFEISYVFALKWHRVPNILTTWDHYWKYHVLWDRQHGYQEKGLYTVAQPSKCIW